VRGGGQPDLAAAADVLSQLRGQVQLGAEEVVAAFHFAVGAPDHQQRPVADADARVQVPILGQERVCFAQSRLNLAARVHRPGDEGERREHIVGFALDDRPAGGGDGGPDHQIQPPDHGQKVGDPVTHGQPGETTHVQHQHRRGPAKPLPDLFVNGRQALRMLVARVQQAGQLRDIGRFATGIPVTHGWSASFARDVTSTELARRPPVRGTWSAAC
jgi:hypothetical protein